MVTEASKIINIFYSYARQDKELRDELNKHLDALKGLGRIKNWHDSEIPPGVDRRKAISNFLNTADIILLLVSPDFMASEDCSAEMKRAMERHADDDACVIPILLRAVGYKNAPFGKLQALPTNVKAITSWPNQDEAFDDVAKGVQRAIEEVHVIPRGKHVKEQWLDIGGAHSDAQRYEEALKAYEHALQIDPSCLPAWIYLGRAFYYLQRYEEALNAFEHALQIDQEDFMIWHEKGVTLYRLKHYNEAIASYDQALQINSDYVLALVDKGHALNMCRRYKEALKFFDKAIRRDSKYADAYNGKGDAMYGSYRHKEALAAFENAIRINPTWGYTYHRMGETLEHLGRSQEAQQAFEKAKELGYNG